MQVPRPLAVSTIANPDMQNPEGQPTNCKRAKIHQDSESGNPFVLEKKEVGLL